MIFCRTSLSPRVRLFIHLHILLVHLIELMIQKAERSTKRAFIGE